ncbi:MAG TPA: site-2 protease family protein [Candidatus Nanoarchaeia archaeon]|nr:site-2 protease family protein [Candidatus Nanoarchaeia archaeon]
MILENVLQFIAKHPTIFIFYGIIIALVIIFRKKIDIQSKVIFLYRMKWGLKWMDKYSSKFRQWIIMIGYIGVGAGFVGLVAISYILIKNLVDLILNPATTTGVSLVLPGLNIPGLGVLPFWYWLISIFVIAIVHEFGHGIVARAHNVEVKNTGIVLFGPIIGAFVEPNEDQLKKQMDIKQYSVLAAGAFSNIILALMALILLNFVSFPLQQGMVEQTGFSFGSYYDQDYPFETAGINPYTLITGINGEEVKTFQEFNEELVRYKPGEKIVVNTPSEDYTLTLVESPDNPKKGFLGIQNIENEIAIKGSYQQGIGKVAFYVLEWFNGLGSGGKGFLFWLYLLSFGIGLFNLLPLPIVDGGRMAQVFFRKLKGEEKGNKLYYRISMFFFLVLLLNLFFPLLVKLF